MIKVAITGSTGLVGSRIIELLKNDFEFVPILQEEVDITDKKSIENKINSIDFDILLHLAAYTNVDSAEIQKDLAYAINVQGTQNILTACEKKNKKLIYISTDFVFDGTNPPYFEDSNPNPTGYYAKTKFQGEQIVKNKAMIVRPSYPYRSFFPQKPDFVHRIRLMLEQGKTLSMMTDAAITPTFVDDIAYALKYLLTHFDTKTYHSVGSDSLSPFDAGILIAKKFSLDKSLIKPTTFAQYSQGKASRSQFSIIKSKNNTFWKMKTFEEGLTEINNSK